MEVERWGCSKYSTHTKGKSMYIDRRTLRQLVESANGIGDTSTRQITEGYERKIISYLEDGGFKKGDAWFDMGTLYVSSKGLVEKAKTILKKKRDIFELPKIVVDKTS
jgi:hypothetical protein